MKKALLMLLFVVACGPVHPTPIPPLPVPPMMVDFNLVACQIPPVETPTNPTYCPGIAGAKFHLDGFGDVVGNADGYAVVRGFPASTLTVTLTITAAGYLPFTVEGHPAAWVQQNSEGKQNTFVLTRAVTMRRGLVRANGHGVKDDDGPLLGVGASYFSLFYLERNEPERLEQNLTALEGADYIRVFGDVGWPSRNAGACLPDYWDVVRHADERAARHGLRLAVTIFAGSPCFPAPNQRTAFVNQWATYALAHPGRIWKFEIANEHIGVADQSEEVALGKLLDSRVQQLVSSSDWGCTATPQYIAPHYRRNPYPDYWRQPWGGVCPDRLVTNDEPVGIQSSVQQDPDARHQASAAAVTWVSGNDSFTLHSGAGVYAATCTGSNPPIPGCPFPGIVREANLLDQPTFKPTLSSILGLRKLLPTDLPNWQRVNGSASNSPVSGIGGPLEGRCYFAVRGTQFYGACGGADVLALPISAARPMVLDLYDPLGPKLLGHFTLAAGQRLPFTFGLDAYVLVGR